VFTEHPLTPSAAPDAFQTSLAFTDLDLADTHTVAVGAPTIAWSGGALPPAIQTSLGSTLSKALSAGIASDANGAGSVSASFSAPDSTFDFLGQNQHLTVTYNVTVTDSANGTSNVEPITVTINGSNDNPVAQVDYNGVFKGSSVSADAAHGVLANDTDIDLGDTLSVTAVGATAMTAKGISIPGQFGTLTMKNDGSYTYTANSNATVAGGGVPQDTFNYTVSDNHGGTAISSVTFTVFPNGTTYMQGTDGNDTLVGGSKPVALDGGGGQDSLVGGSGADILIGGTGNDTMTGGQGDDVFVFGSGNKAFGQDVITDFTHNADKLQFSTAIFKNYADLVSHATWVNNGADMVITYDNTDTITLRGVGHSLTSGDVIFV
jgi:VCBS repeat-containing protein